MWCLAFGIYAVCKGLSWSVACVSAPWWKHLGCLVAWPGMDGKTFLASRPEDVSSPSIAEWLLALVKLGLGLGLLWGIVPTIVDSHWLLRGWVGMVGLVFVLHFGLFHLLSCMWRSIGVAATPLMNWPVLSESLAEFWGRRWNLAFRDLTHRFLFAPLRRPLGPTGALLAGFVVSGLVHDLVISWPSAAGWGWPTLYFTLQGAALILERSHIGRRLGLGRGVPGRLYCLAVVALPSPLLVHVPFVREVIDPFLTAIGAAA